MADLIDRQAAIDSIDRYYKDKRYITRSRTILSAICRDMKSTMDSLPSAQPERKHGYWVESQEHVYMGNSVKEWTNWYCSECDAPNDKPSDFCPSCGADMRGEQDG